MNDKLNLEHETPHFGKPLLGVVLSLFDGMSCGQIALNRAGISYGKYYASEIDKHAIKVTQHNYPNTIQLGDVTKVKASDLPKIDLLIGGSPCQGFSFAGKGLNFEDPRSKLFFEFVRLKNETQPKYWLLENVKMKAEHQNIISEILGVKPILINSKLVSAQSRERLYWTNIPIATLSDKNIVIADVVGIKTDNKSNEIIVTKNIYPKKGQNGNVYAINGKCKTLSAGVGITGNGIGSSNAPKIEWDNEQGWRRLTATECERLQTVPDNYTDCVSDTQRYKMLGNGWTVDVIAHIFGSLLNGA
jgi:site-specific DNA-cytosine methylase